MDAVVLTGLLAWRAFPGARLLTLVGADQEALTRALAVLMESPFKAGMAGTWACMATIQWDRAFGFAFHRHPVFHLHCDPALHLLVVATFQCDHNHLKTLNTAFLPTGHATSVPTFQIFLTRLLTAKLALRSGARDHLLVATLWDGFQHFHHAWSTALKAQLGATMAIFAEHLLTGLHTLKLFVL